MQSSPAYPQNAITLNKNALTMIIIMRQTLDSSSAGAGDDVISAKYIIWKLKYEYKMLAKGLWVTVKCDHPQLCRLTPSHWNQKHRQQSKLSDIWYLHHALKQRVMLLRQLKTGSCSCFAHWIQIQSREATITVNRYYIASQVIIITCAEIWRENSLNQY